MEWKEAGQYMCKMDQKNILRRIVKEIRAGLSDEEIASMSEKITEKIVHMEEYKRARVVFLYMDLPGEVRMHSLMERSLEDGKRVAVPKVEGKEIHFYRIESFTQLSPGRMNILEPDPKRCPCLDGEEEAFMILPGLAFDRSCTRVGYGGGFYDRYLKGHRKHPTAAVCFECQLFDAVPGDEHDIMPDVLITEKMCYRNQ